QSYETQAACPCDFRPLIPKASGTGDRVGAHRRDKVSWVSSLFSFLAGRSKGRCMSIASLIRDADGVAEKDGFQYLHGLVDEDQVSTGGVIKPAIPIADVHRKGKIAGRLTKLTGGKIRVTYSPASFIEGDREAQGHLYSGWWTTDR